MSNLGYARSLVCISGQKAGLWYSFKTGEGGNLLQLIQRKYGLDFQKSLVQAAQMLGLTAGECAKEPGTFTPAKTASPTPDITDKSDPAPSEIKQEHSKSSLDKSLDNTTPHLTKSPRLSPPAKTGKIKDFEIEL